MIVKGMSSKRKKLEMLLKKLAKQ